MTQHPPIRTFKPRRRGLAPARAATFERLAPRFLVEEVGPPLDAATMFGRAAPLVLDIGIGLGDTLVAMAEAQPELAVVGCDVHTPGIVSTLVRLDELGLDNVRLVHGDALVFLDRLAPACVTGIRIFFPDPWPKIRQRHRRLVRADVVARLVDLMRPAGWVHLATDSDDYATQMQHVCDDHPLLVGGPIARPVDRPVTRYERRGVELGHRVVDLRYERVG